MMQGMHTIFCFTAQGLKKYKIWYVSYIQKSSLEAHNTFWMNKTRVPGMMWSMSIECL